MNLKNKGQIFIYEIFIILLISILIISLQTNILNNYQEYIINKNQFKEKLEEVLLLDKLINIGEFVENKNINYKLEQIYTIKIENKIIYSSKNNLINNENVNCYNRGITKNNKFNILEVCFYE